VCAVSLRASQRRHIDDEVCSCGPGARRNLARAGGVPEGAILTTRGRDGSTAVVPGAGTPPSCPARAARTWTQWAARLPLAGCRRAPRGGNIWLHGPTTNGHAQRPSFGWGSHPGTAALSGGGGSGIGLGPQPRPKAMPTRRAVHRLAHRPRLQSAGRDTDPPARRRLGPGRRRRLGLGHPVRRPPDPHRRAHGPDQHADLRPSHFLRVGGHLRRRVRLDRQRRRAQPHRFGVQDRPRHQSGRRQPHRPRQPPEHCLRPARGLGRRPRRLAGQDQPEDAQSPGPTTPGLRPPWRGRNPPCCLCG
jgi:hypothetical protein